MAEIIPMTEEQKFQLEIYKLVMNQNAAAEVRILAQCEHPFWRNVNAVSGFT